MQRNFGCIWCNHVFEVLVAHYRPLCRPKVHHEGRRPPITFKRPPLGIVTHENRRLFLDLFDVAFEGEFEELEQGDIEETNQGEDQIRWVCRLACLRSGIWLIQNESPYSRSAIAECRAMSNLNFLLTQCDASLAMWLATISATSLIFNNSGQLHH
jgi:hypothetical protein